MKLTITPSDLEDGQVEIEESVTMATALADEMLSRLDKGLVTRTTNHEVMAGAIKASYSRYLNSYS